MCLIVKINLFVLLCFAFVNNLNAQTLPDAVIANSDSIQARFPRRYARMGKIPAAQLKSRSRCRKPESKKYQTVRQTVVVSLLVSKEGKISEVTVDTIPPKCIRSLPKKLCA